MIHTKKLHSDDNAIINRSEILRILFMVDTQNIIKLFSLEELT